MLEYLNVFGIVPLPVDGSGTPSPGVAVCTSTKGNTKRVTVVHATVPSARI